MTDRKKPGWAFWATVGLSLPVLYVLGFGPACWLTDRRFIDSADSGWLYQPILRACVNKPGRLSAALRYYGLIGTQRHRFVEDDVLETMRYGK